MAVELTNFDFCTFFRGEAWEEANSDDLEKRISDGWMVENGAEK